MPGRARRATRPTPCLFGASLGLRADFSRLARECGHRTRGGFALGSLELASGKSWSRAGVPRVNEDARQGIPAYGGKAAPTRATLHQAHSGKRPFSTVWFSTVRCRKVARSRSIERNDFVDFGIPKSPIFGFSVSRFRVLAISQFSRFPIEKESRNGHGRRAWACGGWSACRDSNICLSEPRFAPASHGARCGQGQALRVPPAALTFDCAPCTARVHGRDERTVSGRTKELTFGTAVQFSKTTISKGSWSETSRQ